VLEPSPPIARSILNKEKGGKPKRMPSLDKPSPIIITLQNKGCLCTLQCH